MIDPRLVFSVFGIVLGELFIFLKPLETGVGLGMLRGVGESLI